MFYYFPDNYRWSLAVLRAIAAGGLFGEIDWACAQLRKASQVKPSGDLEAWHAKWKELGQQLEHKAKEALAEGYTTTASDFSLRASIYYQWAEGLLDPEDPRSPAMYLKHLSCFETFASNSQPAIVLVDIPFGHQVIPAYIVKAVNSLAPKSPVCMVCDGLDANKEEMFYVALSLARRGITSIAFDGPGQGSALRIHGQVAQHDFEKPVSAIVDWLILQDGVDSHNIGIVAASWGGYYAPRAVAFEKRIKACAIMGAVFDTHACMVRRVGYIPGKGATQLGANAPLGTTGKQILRILGVSDWEIAFQKLEAFRLAPVAHNIECDLFIVNGANDPHAPPSEAQQLIEAVSSRHKKLRVFTELEGGAAHVNLDRPEPALSMVCDWMKERLSP